jgi:hypothetical protein
MPLNATIQAAWIAPTAPVVPHPGTRRTRHDGGSTMKTRIFAAAASLTALLAALGGTVYGR